jgi:hypothetical protein
MYFYHFSMMEEKKEQKIIVFTTLTAADPNLILAGIRIAMIFKKELCLVYQLKKNENKVEVKEKLTSYIIALKGENPDLKASVLLTVHKMNMLPDILADDHEAIIMVANALLFRKYASAVSNSPIPFLFINPQVPLPRFKKIVVPIDIRKETSDTLLWCSWFGRFNQSEIIAVAAGDKGKNSKQQVSHNVVLAKKLFQKTGVTHQIYRGRKSSLQNSFEAAEFARTTESELLVLLGSSVITLLDLLIGIPERKLISRAGNLAVLLVNPRRDNYILCD